MITSSYKIIENNIIKLIIYGQIIFRCNCSSVYLILILALHEFGIVPLYFNYALQKFMKKTVVLERVLSYMSHDNLLS